MRIVTLQAIPSQLSVSCKIKEWELQVNGLKNDDYKMLSCCQTFTTTETVSGIITAKWNAPGEGYNGFFPPMPHVTAMFNLLADIGYELRPKCIITGSEAYKGYIWTFHATNTS